MILSFVRALISAFKARRELVPADELNRRHNLLRRVWGPQNSGDPRLVRAFVKKLRRKLGDVATSPAYIVTEPRVGYRMPKAVSSEPSGC